MERWGRGISSQDFDFFWLKPYSFVNSFGVNSTEADIVRMMTEADTNKNGVLDHAEFDHVVGFNPK